MHFFFTWEALFLLILLGGRKSMTLGQLQSENNETVSQVPEHEIPGCRVVPRDDLVHVTVYCNEFRANETAMLLPGNTQRIQFYQVPDFPTDRPLFPHLLELEELELPNNKLSNVTRQMFEGLSSLKILKLQKNYIKRFFNDTFIDNPLLEMIDLSQNYILSIGSIAVALSRLSFFRELKCTDNMLLRWLVKSDFIPLQDVPLQKLDLSGSQIRLIEDDAFFYLKNLSELDLSATPLNETAVTNLSLNLHFTNLSELRVNNLIMTFYFPLQLLTSLNNSKISLLDISYNRLLGFPYGNLWFPELKYLDLTSCGISIILEGSGSAMPNLETLLLKRNRIGNIHRELYDFTNLKELDISSFESNVPGSRFVISDFAFNKSSKLENLYLNQIPFGSTIRRNTLHGLVNLQKLSISACVLSEIEDFAFESLGKLTSLDLTQNFIGSLSNNTFYGLKNVKLLTLSYNSINFLTTVHPFQHTESLESLMMNRNKISFFPSGIFRHLPNLGLLFVAENFLIPWNEQLLPRHKNMTVLKISKNAISYFTPEMLEDIQQLEYIDFSNNPLNCSMCGMSDLQAWMGNTSTYINYITGGVSDTNAYICHEPPELANEHILDVIISTEHCLPIRVNVLRLVMSITTPFIICILVVFIVWRFFSWDIKYCYFHLRLRVKKYKETVKADNYHYDAFVSYSESDLLWVRHQLVPAIETGQPVLSMCIPDRDFDASDYVANNVITAIEQSRTTILVLSNSYMKSEWCKFELEMAQHKLFEETRNGLIIILLEDIERSLVTKNLKYVIRTRTCIPWTQSPVGQKLFWERLRLAVAKPVDKVLLKHIT